MAYGIGWLVIMVGYGFYLQWKRKDARSYKCTFCDREAVGLNSSDQYPLCAKHQQQDAEAVEGY